MPPLWLPANQHESSSLLERASSSISHRTTTLFSLLKRQTTTIISADYSSINDSPTPGTVVGIVLGSVAGFLLLLWLLYTLMGGNMGIASSDIGSVVIQQRKRSRRGSSRRTSRTETVEVRRERPPPPPVERVERVERVIVEERRPVATVLSDSVGSEDEVVVIEEHSPPRRASSSKKVKEVRESGYRTVDPLAYGGGDRPLRDVERRESRRSRDSR